LDFRNVSIIGHYIKERTKDAQFLVISLRNNMFELADRVVGIYKTHNASKSLPLNPHAFGQVLASATATAQGARSSADGNHGSNDKENRAPVQQVLSV
jgi:structural maintenance of chromosome 4